MKKKIIITILLIFMFTIYSSYIYATEEIYDMDMDMNIDINLDEMNSSQAMENSNNYSLVKAKVIYAGEVREETVLELAGYDNQKARVQELKVQVLEGEYKDEIHEFTYTISYGIDAKLEGYPLSKGNRVLVWIVKDSDSVEIVVQDIVRENYLIYMVIAMFLIILAIGRLQGLKAIIGLVITITVIFGFMLRYITKGHSPILIALMSSIIIIITTFVIIGGLKKKTITAAIGTIGGVVCACIIGFIFGVLAKLSGISEEAVFLSMNAKDVAFDFRELLFVGIIIASLGACMDVGMSIASALDEIKQKNPKLSWIELFKSGINIGNDTIGTMVNTLILAYVGGAITLVLLLMASDMSLSEIINKEEISADIVSALSASMGVVFTVPITAIVYALFNKKNTQHKATIGNRDKDGRSLKI